MTEIIIPNEENFEEIKQRIIEQGVNKFHVLADFDRTLTKAFYKEGKANSIISHLRSGRYLTEDYAPRSHALFDEYHPIEIDPNVPMSEKKKKMGEWWRKHFDLLIEVGLDMVTIKKSTEDMIKEDVLDFRPGVTDFFKFLEQRRIPLVIMSSSVGDLIIEFMKQKGVYSKNVSIVSNLLEWDKSGKARGIKEIVHVFNKDEMTVNHLPNYSDLKKRRNVLLLGDGLGDVEMITGFKYDNLIKIGFLNENVEQNMELFKQNFDVVLLGDGDFSFINDLVKDIK